jgi:putative RNA 2'-phosphotransferase
MISEKESIGISKFLSLVLRHQPEKIGIELDENGWASVEQLLQKSKKSGVKLDFETLQYIVNTNSKKRFAFNDAFNKIRASQGHSVAIELGYEPQKPPEILYHGTGTQSVNSILQTGLQKRNRNHVHLSIDIETAVKVGSRHGKPIVFEVLAEQMYQQQFKFYLSDNGVWLTYFVPPSYLKLLP